MEKNSIINHKQLLKRFVSDCNLPIQVLEQPYFNERLELFEDEFKSRTKFNNLVDLIGDRFDSSADEFLKEYSKVRDNIIVTVTNSEAYKKFNSDADLMKGFNTIVGSRNLYTNEQDGGLFISFDMKKANFQALKHADPNIVLGAETYEEFIGKFTDLDYIKESKYTRQVIFGQMNPKRTMHVEKEVTSRLAEKISNELDKRFIPFSINADEIIFKFEGSEDEFEAINPLEDIEFEGCNYRFNKFKLHARRFELATSSAILTVYEKEDILKAHKRFLHCCPTTYYPQVYKALHGLEIEPNDLVFYYEHELCRFLNPLRLIK